MPETENGRSYHRLLQFKVQNRLPQAALACALCVAPVFGRIAESQQPPQTASQTSATVPPAGQNASLPESTKPSAQPPEPIEDWDDRMTPMTHASTYQTFFAWVEHLDAAAAQNESEGKDGSWLRNHIQETIGVTPAEANLIKQSTLRSRQEYLASSEKLRAVIRAQVAKAPDQPQWAEYEEMYKEQAAATMQAVADLEEKLGPVAAAKFKDYMEKHWYNAVQKHGLLPGYDSYSPVHDLWYGEKMMQAMAEDAKRKHPKPEGQPQTQQQPQQEKSPEVKQ